MRSMMRTAEAKGRDSQNCGSNVMEKIKVEGIRRRFGDHFPVSEAIKYGFVMRIYTSIDEILLAQNLQMLN